jgi:hypothetical protein
MLTGSDVIYFPSGIIEQTWEMEDESHAENQVTVKNLGAFMWGPLEETVNPQD